MAIYDLALWYSLEFCIRYHRNKTNKSKVKCEKNSLIVPNNAINIFSGKGSFQGPTLSGRGLYHPGITTFFFSGPESINRD